MVSVSLKTDFKPVNSFTGYWCSLAFGTRHFSEFKVGFCVFLENEKTDLRLIFFSWSRRKHLFNTTCIEK